MALKSYASSPGGILHYERAIEPIGTNVYGGGVAPTVGRVYLRPIQVLFTVTIGSITIGHLVAAGNGILGLYADNGDTPVGGAVVVETASIASVVTAQDYPIASTRLPPGLYWFATEFSDAVERPYSTATQHLMNDPAVALRTCYYDHGAFGALTDPCPAVTNAGLTRLIMGQLNVTSIP